MTAYDYNDRMAQLCARASKVMTALDDKVMADVYDHAADGFAAKATSLPLDKACQKVEASMTERLARMDSWIANKEQVAAYRIKEGANGIQK